MKAVLSALALPLAVVLSQLALVLYVLVLAAKGGFLADETATCLGIILPPLALYLTCVALRVRQLRVGIPAIPWFRIGGALAFAAAAFVLVTGKANNQLVTSFETFKVSLAVLVGCWAAYLGFLLAVPTGAGSIAATAKKGTFAGALDCSEASLRTTLTDQFTREECHLLLRGLGVDPEKVPGNHSGTQPYFAGEIVDYFRRHGRLEELCEHVRASRPGITGAA